MTGTPILSIDGLRFAYGDIVALDGVTAEIPAGCIGLVGANGAGKTTLLKLLLGVLQPAAGKIRVLDHPVPHETLEVRSRVGWMPESDCLPPDQTAADFLGYAAELGSLPVRAARQRASDILGLVGLHEERFRFMDGFSTGMKQRAKLAQAIVHDPDLVLLDEPTAGLDPEARGEMLDLVRRLDDFGINAVISSHLLTDIETVCNWVVMLDGGKVLRSEPLTALSTPDVAELEIIGDFSAVAREARALGAEVEVNGDTLTLSMPGGDPFMVARDAVVAVGAAFRRLGVKRSTLEDVFMAGGDGDG